MGIERVMIKITHKIHSTELAKNTQHQHQKRENNTETKTKSKWNGSSSQHIFSRFFSCRSLKVECPQNQIKTKQCSGSEYLHIIYVKLIYDINYIT